MEHWELQQMQGLPLEAKIIKTQLRIREWYEYWKGDVFVSFSGGKDSTVLLDIAKKLYPDIEVVFSNTGLEYPEIREFVKSKGRVTWISPKKSFREIILEKGYPVVSKEVAETIYYARRGSRWAINKLEGLHSISGNPYGYNQDRYAKYKYLLNAPFGISSLCCEELKKKPFCKYERATKKKSITGSMACESQLRQTNYLKTGCNAFASKRPISNPLGFWTDKDIWEYIHKYNIPYSEIYNKGLDRTGCMFCMFGVHVEKSPNRFQIMKNIHPGLWEYCLKPIDKGGLGLAKVLDFIKVPYEEENHQLTINELKI